MESNCFFIVFAIIFGIVQAKHWDFTTNNYGDQSEQDVLLHNMFKEELQELRKELTASFVEEHSRKKRATQSYIVEAEITRIKGPNDTFVINDEMAAITVIFQDNLYILDEEGIYRLDLESSTVNRSIISTWALSKDHRIITTIEKSSVLFILVENSKEGFSLIYTFSSFSQSLVLRQRIRNSGFVTNAKFFVFYDQLHLIILNDNKVHSLTVCPIFIWAGTYFDEMHTIQTRGANVVEAFVIEGYQYLAICQSVDAAGNTEVGTQVVRMDRRGELEKVQLLYSNNPVALHFTRNFHEHILIIAQKKEPAIVYFFGGYDFVYLQHLESLKGDQVSIISVLGPNEETFILASNGRSIRIFIRATEYSSLTALMFAPYPNIAFEAPNDYIITGLTAQHSHFNSDFILAITYRPVVNSSPGNSGETIVQLQALVFEKRPKIFDTYKQPEDKLSTCLATLKSVLDQREPILKYLQRSNDTILRKSSNTIYDGVLNSQTRLSITSQSIVDNINIKPDLNLEDEIKLSPSQLQSTVVTDMKIFNNNMIPKLANVLINDETNILSGHLEFVNEVIVHDLIASYSILKLSNLNNIPWEKFQHQGLRNDNEAKLVTGNWTVDKFSTGEVRTDSTISGINLQDILLTQTEHETVQIVTGHLVFGKNVEFWESVDIPSLHTINHIEVSDIANRSNSSIEITGTKTATHVKGRSGLNVKLVNQVYLDVWYNSVLKATGGDQLANGTYYFEGDFVLENLEAQLVNRVNWNEFVNQILFDGEDQLIPEQVHFGSLVTEELQGDQINGVVIDDLLTVSKNQNITANIVTNNLVIHGDLFADLLNGIQIPEDVVLYGENPIIVGPIEFHGLIVDKIELAKGAYISGVDVEQKVKESKTIIYTLGGNETRPIVFTGKFYAQNANLPTVNGISIVNFTGTHWKTQGSNVISTPNFDFRNFNVIVENSFSTALMNHWSPTEYVQINSNDSNDEFLNLPITFTEPVIIYGDIQMVDNITLNNVDLSKIVNHIVNQNSTGIIHGVKRFQSTISTQAGIRVDTINNRNIDNNIVMLNGKNFYEIPGKTIFSDIVESNFVVLNGSTTVGGTVNTLNIEDIIDTTVYINKFSIIRSDVEFFKDIYVTDFNVGRKLNNFSITQILDTLVPLNSGSRLQYLDLNIVVEGDIDFQGPVNIGLINGVDPSSYFSALVNKSANEFIQNQKLFDSQVIVRGDLNCFHGIINDVDLQQLESQALSKTKNQTVTGKIIFKKIEAIDISSRTLCGIPVNDFALIDDNTAVEIDSPVYFNTNESTVIEQDVYLGKLFNGQNITQIAETLLNLQGNRTFSKVTCHGNLTWKKSRVHGEGLSYVFENAVVTTRKENQTVTGTVTFLEGLKATIIEAPKWLNNVDLNYLLVDGILTENKQDLNFTGSNWIQTLNITEGGWLETLPVFYTQFVNGVNLTRLNEIVVRRNGGTVIRGRKILKNGIFTESLNAADVNGCSLDSLARVNDSRVIRSLTFENIEGLNNLYFNHLEGIDWKQFLLERVTFDSPQKINGNITFNGNVTVKNCSIERINNVNVIDLVVKHSNHVQRITGPKTVGGLIVVGNIQADSINSYDIDDVQSKIVYKNKPRTINPTVYFEGPIYLHNDLEVPEHINEGQRLQHISSSFDAQLNEVIIRANATKGAQQKSQFLLKVLHDELEDSAIWLDYFRLTNRMRSVGKKDRVQVAVFDNYARIGFSKMIPVTPSENGGLPNGCLCNSIDFVEIGLNYVRQLEKTHCKNIFELVSPYSDASFTVYSTFVSYNETCKSTDSGITDIIIPDDVEHTTHFPTNFTSISRVSTGFISDAKMFSAFGIDYIVIAQFYHYTEDPSFKGEITVYSVINSTVITLVQTIPTKGTIKLSIEHVNNVWFLAAANSQKNVPIPKYEDDNDECETVSEIFIWQSSPLQPHEGRFVLLREVTTKNVIDVEIIKTPRKSDNLATSIFITFVHSGNVIEIFKFDWVHQNFYLEQTMAFDDEYQITALTSFSLKDITYLAVSSIPQGLRIYEYRCIEGFTLYLEVPLFQVEDISPVIVNNRLLFPIASSLETFIAEGKIQGFLSVK